MTIPAYICEYTEWTAGLARVEHQIGNHVYLRTPFSMPCDKDEALCIVVKPSGPSKIRLSDGGAIAGFYWRHFIDLKSRYDAMDRLTPVFRSEQLAEADGELYRIAPKKDAAVHIHEFCTSLLTVAALVYTIPGHISVHKHRQPGAQKPKTLLKQRLGKLDLKITEAPENPDDAEHRVLYEDFPSTVFNYPHKYDLFVQNGVANAVDCVDYGKVGPEKAKAITLEAAWIAQKALHLAGTESAMKYRLLYSPPSAALRDRLGDPLSALKNNDGITLIEATQIEAVDELARDLEMAVNPVN